MVTVRSIIVEALSRANLVSRRQTAPADMTESAFRLLRGIASTYSNDNLLQFLVCEVKHDLDRREFVLGEIDPEAESEYLPVDIETPNIKKVNKVYWHSKEPADLGNSIELKFASPDDFDAYPDGSGIYTCQPVNDLQIVFKTKLLPSSSIELKFTYNRKWSFDLDSELRIPEEYVELFTVALTVALAKAFPRLSNEQVTLMKEDLTKMENNVRVSSRAVKYVSRRPVRTCVNQAAFLSGSFLQGV